MKERIGRHKDRTIKARGHTVDDVADRILGVVQERRYQNAVGAF
jgi:hypothetical protein